MRRVHVVGPLTVEGWIPASRWLWGIANRRLPIADWGTGQSKIGNRKSAITTVVWYLGLVAAAYAAGYLTGMGAGMARAIAVLME